ncbi:efflux RND transporter periplasmic adaptor subunit [Anaerophaga thermohalophila]|uniref:efflux RND transporter periplasmic adaptor subunit n=1 Tax=Anaerophaga thermohalophila TaxID=177400 RepID=UPI0003079D58|nr:efflux RND transporter periplasmic adaptor subunit [Anaerophaga thermohalophila]
MMRKYIYLIAAIVVLILAIVLLTGKKSTENNLKPRIHVVEKGTIVNTVTATGTVEPIDQVEVGTQVSGVIERIYTDYNERVKKGQLIARIDESSLKARLLQAKASLASAQNELDYQTKNFRRIKMLFEKEMVSETEYDEALYRYNNAKASVESLQSEVEQAEVNLSYARIYSPIDGVVLSRSVEEGQTVAASFNTPTLFLIARDLTRMQVEADVDEADIGQVETGQKVTFTVDAFPDTEFTGEVTQVRLEPVIESNVVTYTVIIDAPNPDFKLKPGLTASVTIITNEAKDVTVVPAAALRFSPAENSPGSMALSSGGGNHSSMPEALPETGEDRVWVWKDGHLHPVIVNTGIEDGVWCEIKSGVLPGDSVVTGIDRPDNLPGRTFRSPFMPGPPGRDKKED